MARRSRNKRIRAAQRGHHYTANRRLHAPIVIRPFRDLRIVSRTSPLTSDRRRWSPVGAVVHAPGARSNSRMSMVGHIDAQRWAFHRPDKVDICVRRHTRREVLFALRRTGKGARSRKRRDRYSDVRC